MATKILAHPIDDKRKASVQSTTIVNPATTSGSPTKAVKIMGKV